MIRRHLAASWRGSDRSRLLWILAASVPLMAWRAVWIGAAVPDDGHDADAIVRHLRAAERRAGLADEAVASESIDVEYRVLPGSARRDATATLLNQQPDTSRGVAPSHGDVRELASLADALNRYGLVVTAVERWDEQAPIWITPGRDGQPGWQGWDDNGDGRVDDAGELGAAWSDDLCVVTANQPDVGGPVRMIDRGAFVPAGAGMGFDQQARYRVTLASRER